MSYSKQYGAGHSGAGPVNPAVSDSEIGESQVRGQLAIQGTLSEKKRVRLVVECLLILWEDLGSIPSSLKKQKW